MASSLVGVGCKTAAYYSQALHGQLEIIAREKPIQRLLNDPQTSAELRKRFQTVLRLRQFARSDLLLRTDSDYLRYADLHRRFVVWNVHAAPKFSFHPKTWWYPVVGRLKYRGFFTEADARRCADGLARNGFEVFVEGVEAYSTLGWFSDPVLNTFIHHHETALAEIIFHELAHRKAFAAGDTDFNEAFATAVAEEGIHRWLARAGDTEAYADYQEGRSRHQQFVQLVLGAREKLAQLYGDPRPGDGAASKARYSQARVRSAEARQELERKKADVIAELREGYRRLKEEWKGYEGYDQWFARSLNNAQLNTVAAYYRLVPAFRTLLEKNNGELEKFYRSVHHLSQLDRKSRERRLLELDPSAR